MRDPTSHFSVGGRLLGMSAKQPFEAIVTRHGATVRRVCRAVVGAVDADDAWSETFLAALRAYPDLPADANVEAWLVTIAHRKAIDLTRRSARRPMPTQNHDGETDPAHLSMGAANDLEQIESDGNVLALLARLPPRQRWAVAYHHLGGLPYAEVAAITGGTAAAARRAAADGISTLRRNLAGDPPERTSR